MHKTTMTEIAHRCGVSLKTVSRVMNGSNQVSEKTKNKVNQSMEELGYQVNLLARGLKQKRTNIVVVFLDRHNGAYLSSWRNVMMRHLFDYARDIGLKLILSSSDSENYRNDETDGFNLLSSGIADGAILMEYLEHDERITYLRKMKMPYVVLGQSKEKSRNAISLDNYKAGYDGANYLKELGYNHICFLTGDKQYYSSKLRVKGFQEALKGSGVKETICYGITTPENAANITQKVILEKDIMQEQRLCLFVPGDERVLGVYRAIYESGKKIPEDIGVFGIDDLPNNENLYPPLSAMCQDFQAIAQKCIDKFIQLRENPEDYQEKQVFYPSQIKIRQSTKIHDITGKK